MSAEEIAELRAELAAVRAELAQMRTERGAPAGAPREVTEPSDARPSVSRRRLIGLAAAGVGGLGLATTVGTSPAAAAKGDSLVIGAVNVNAPVAGVNYATVLKTTNDSPQAQVVFESGNGNALPDTSSALTGWASTTGAAADGVSGLSDRANGNGVLGRAAQGVGGRFEGVTNLRLPAADTPGPPLTSNALPGDLVEQADGLWLCVVGGSPGTWRKLAGAATAGAFHAITPARVYDSRVVAPRQPIASGGTRTVSVTDAISSTGAVSQAHVVPVGATAISVNLTVTRTSRSGYLSVYPAGAPRPSTSSINFTGRNEQLANGLVLTLGAAQQVSVYASSGTDFLIDVSGYYL